MKLAKIQASVKCEIEVEVGIWGGESTFANLAELAGKDGINIIKKILDEWNRDAKSQGKQASLVGHPCVKFVVFEGEAKGGE